MHNGQELPFSQIRARKAKKRANTLWVVLNLMILGGKQLDKQGEGKARGQMGRRTEDRRTRANPYSLLASFAHALFPTSEYDQLAEGEVKHSGLFPDYYAHVEE